MNKELYKIQDNNVYYIDHVTNLIYKSNDTSSRAFPISSKTFDCIIKGLLLQGYKFIDEYIGINKYTLMINNDIKNLILNNNINEISRYNASLVEFRKFNYLFNLFKFKKASYYYSFSMEIFANDNNFIHICYDDIIDKCFRSSLVQELDVILNLLNRRAYRCCVINSLAIMEKVNIDLRDKNKKIKLDNLDRNDELCKLHSKLFIELNKTCKNMNDKYRNEIIHGEYKGNDITFEVAFKCLLLLVTMAILDNITDKLLN